MRDLEDDRRRAPWLLAGLLMSALGALATPACAAAPAVARPPASAPSRADAEPKLGDKGWGVARSARLGLKLPLPERNRWQLSEARGSFQLTHEATGTTLSIQRWRASRLPQIESCASELQQRTPLPVVDDTSLVDRRRASVPEGFVTRFDLLALPGTSARLRGHVLAVGAGVGECLAAIATTEAASEQELAERLRLLDFALEHMRRTHIEDRVQKSEPRSE